MFANISSLAQLGSAKVHNAKAMQLTSSNIVFGISVFLFVLGTAWETRI